MDKTLFKLLNTGAPAATLVIRLLAGLVFLAEGIKKSIFPTELPRVALSSRSAKCSIANCRAV